MAEDVKFAPVWLFGPDGQMVMCEDRAHYDEVLGRGWQDSPAKFGVETHPSHPVQQMSTLPGVSAAVLPPANAALEELVVTLQSHLEEMRVVVLAQQEALDAHDLRLEALEAAPLAMQAPLVAAETTGSTPTSATSGKGKN